MGAPTSQQIGCYQRPPAVEGLVYEQKNGRFVITGGVATWDGQSLEVCQQQN